MRGPDIQQDSLFSTVSPESRVPKDSPYAPDTGHGRCGIERTRCRLQCHLLRTHGRDSIPPEKLLRARLLMAFHTFRSERRWMKQIDYNLLFCRFCRLLGKNQGTAAKLACLGHLLMENRNGLVVDARVTQATGTAEREAARKAPSVGLFSTAC